MANDQQRGKQAADRANQQGKRVDYNKLNTAERDAALAREKQLKGKK